MIDADGFKICSKCKLRKHRSEFTKRSRTKDGLEYWCKSCAKELSDAHREHLRELDRASYIKNREFRIAKSSKYNCIKYGRTLPEKWQGILDEKKEQLDNRPLLKTWDDSLRRLRQYKANNRERHNAKNREYSKTDRGRTSARLKTRRYLTRKMGLINNLSQKEVDFLLYFQSNRCGCCNKEFSSGVPYEIDHIIPVSKGGHLVLSNVQLLCRSCNASKRDKTIRYIPTIESFYSELT